MADKEVKIKVGTDVELSKVQALEDNINKIKLQKIQMDIQTNTAKLDDVNSKIESTKAKLAELKGKADVDDSEVKQLETELERLESDKLNIQLDLETSKLDEAKSKLDRIDDETINPQISTISAMEGIEQIGQGFDRLKQGASEVGQRMGEVLQSAGRMEQTEAFLSMNMGADQAKQKLQEIRSVTDQLPGDDVTLQNLLSQAAMKDASMTTDAFNQMGSAAADYMAAMQNFGKTSTETQQDLMNYILAGNTAEIERSPILQSHVDKLKEGTTVQERAKLLQEALNEEGWAGIASQDIYNNKFQQFNDMIERGKMNLGGMFQEAAKGAMDWVMQLDESTHGLVGMGIALAGFATPLTDTIMGLGQMATGIKAVKEAADFTGLTDKLGGVKDALGSVKTKALDVASSVKGGLSTAFSTIGKAASDLATSIKSGLLTAFTTLKTTMTGTIIPALRNVATALLNAGRQALTAGLNALKSVAMWTAQKLAVVGSTLAEYGLAAAQTILNAVMSMNPIMIIVIALVALAAALIWAYNNVDWFREMVDNAWASIQGFAGWLSGVFMGAVTGIGDAFNNAGQTLQNAFTGAVEYVQGVLQGLYDYIMTLGGLLPEGVNITGNQIVDSIIAVMVFIATLPLQLAMIFMNIIASTLGFGNNFTQTMMMGAVNAVNGFISWVSQLPGRAGAFLSSVVARASSFAGSFVSSIVNAASSAVNGFLNSISEMAGGLANELNNMLSLVGEWAATLPQKFWDAGVNAVKNFLSALGIASPGTMQRMLVWEVTEMGKRVPEESRQLLSNVSNLGEDIVKEFGDPTLGVGIDSFNSDLKNGTLNSELASGSYGSQINFYFSDITVDNDDRMEKIYDYITRRLHWNNKTAGRGV